MEYIVLQQHYGDKQYWAGDVRVVKDADTAAYLIAQGLIAPEGKAQPAPQNKAAPPPQNKSGK